MRHGKVLLDIADGVATLTLNDPDALNAVSLDMLEDLDAALTALEAPDSGARALLWTGAGRGFCSGAKLNDPRSAEKQGGARDFGRVLETHYHPLLLRLRALDMPIVTAVNGVAAGVGMSFALMGDMVLAARSSYFLQAFRRIGLVPDGGSTWMLPRLIGTRRAMELSLMGEKLPAGTALDWGLISRVHDDDALMDEARKLAADLAAGPTQTLGKIRKLYWESPENSYEDQLRLERWLQREAGETQDSAEGIKAFLEKRPAQFTGN